MKTPMRFMLMAAACMAVAACKGEDPQVAAQAAAAQAAAREEAAAKVAAQFDEAVANQQWQLAKGYGDILLAEHPDSAAATRVRPQHEGIKAKADAGESVRSSV